MGEHYYNTNNESGLILAKSESKGKTTAQIVSDYMQLHYTKTFAPHQVWQACFDTDKVPLTSVRRAMTDLTSLEHGEKLEMMPEEYMILGLYGKNVHVWRWKQETGQLKLL